MWHVGRQPLCRQSQQEKRVYTGALSTARTLQTSTSGVKGFCGGVPLTFRAHNSTMAAMFVPLRIRPSCSILIMSVLLAGCATRGDRLVQEGHWDEAVAAYQYDLKHDPFNPSLQAKLSAAKGRAAAAHEEQGRALLKERKIAQAIEAFTRAVGLEPSRLEYHAALAEALQLKEAQDRFMIGQRLLKAGRQEEAIESFERALELDPGLKEAQDTLVQLAEKQQADLSPLAGSQQPITLKFQNARTKEVFEVLARSGGINILFDKDLKDDPVTIFIKDASFEEALNLILTTQNLFMRRVAPDTILVIPKSKQKLDQYQDLMIRTFYLSNGKAKDMVNLLRTMLESKRIFVNEDLNAIVIRDSPDKVRLAERIIYANDRTPGEVMFEIEVLEVDKTKSLEYGVKFAKQAGAAVVPPGTTAFPGASALTYTFRQLTDIGTGSYLFSLPTSILLDFFKQESDARTLANPKIRVVNNKQAKINIGDKVPILLSTTTTLPVGTTGAPIQSTATSIEFKDVGVKLTVEPTIHLNYDVTIKLQIEVTRLGDEVILQESPRIRQFRFGTRTAETSLTLKDGESVVIGGLIQDEDRKTVTKVPGLGDIPVLGELFKATKRDTVTTDVILTITPRIVRALEAPGVEDQAFWSGTEEAYALKPLFTDVGGVPRREGRSPAPLAPAAPPLETPPATGPSPLASATPLPQAPVALSLRPPDGTVLVGQETMLEVLVANVEALTEGALTVSYDPKVLEFRQALAGEFLKRDGDATATAEVNPTAGTVVVQLKRAEGAAGVSGAGVLVSLAFAGKAPGVSPLAVQASRLLSAGEESISMTGGQGIVRVR